MNARNGNESAHNSPSDIISTFNHFFTNVPTNKSFDMTYKVYIKDLADTEDRTTLSQRSSSVNLQGAKPVTIASYGIVPTMSASSTGLEPSYLSVPSVKSSSTNLTTKSTDSNYDNVTMSQVERICADNLARKQRSMVDLTEYNRKYGSAYRPPAPSAATPPTIYENLSILSSTSSAASSRKSVPSTFTEKQHEFGKLMDSETESDGSVELLIKVTDCFD